MLKLPSPTKLAGCDGLDPSVHCGPQVSRAEQQRVLDHIELGKKGGARVAAQAQLSTDPECEDGLIADVIEDMRITNEERFGTIVTDIPFDPYEDAISISNSPDHGLTCAIYGKDAIKANHAARAVDVGMTFNNDYTRMALGVPSGGTKHSGYGRQHCIETPNGWRTTKSIHTVSDSAPVPSDACGSDLIP
ncbi:hypothetical protein AC579_2818 [Pseudocercospora musae]|uniref:aldehyde dehydrogenase (NAD(+)) n=1 Tax=Pseudocercospora musae TaxID=113226 RepID=A0A139IKP7_9PEZI|nr:hypothetical protein AC579_2818 [Pseudocercospora musae]